MTTFHGRTAAIENPPPASRYCDKERWVKVRSSLHNRLRNAIAEASGRAVVTSVGCQTTGRSARKTESMGRGGRGLGREGPSPTGEGGEKPPHAGVYNRGAVGASRG